MSLVSLFPRRVLAAACILLGILASFTATVNALADRIPAAVFRPENFRDAVPEGWELQNVSGQPSLELSREGGAFFLHLAAPNEAAFGIRREIKVDITEYPYLTWRWQARRLPPRGDVRHARTDDQALQLYIAFTPTAFPARLNTPVIGYIWDSQAPLGWMGKSSQPLAGKIRYVVLRNSGDKTNVWFDEKRNILEDFRKLFPDVNGGLPNGPTVGMQIYINTQRTGDPAEGLIGEIFFTRK